MNFITHSRFGFGLADLDLVKFCGPIKMQWFSRFSFRLWVVIEQLMIIIYTDLCNFSYYKFLFLFNFLLRLKSIADKAKSVNKKITR